MDWRRRRPLRSDSNILVAEMSQPSSRGAVDAIRRRDPSGLGVFCFGFRSRAFARLRLLMGRPFGPFAPKLWAARFFAGLGGRVLRGCSSLFPFAALRFWAAVDSHNFAHRREGMGTGLCEIPRVGSLAGLNAYRLNTNDIQMGCSVDVFQPRPARLFPSG
jgi:hypothetical protein